MAENRLQIDSFSLRQSYKNGELDRIEWIPVMENPEDELTKIESLKSSVLLKFMKDYVLKVYLI